MRSGFTILKAEAAYEISKKAVLLPQLVLTAVFILLIASVVLMILKLRKNLKETLYDYENIMLLGLMYFDGILTVMMAVYFVSCVFEPDNLSVYAIFHKLVGFPRIFSYYAVFFMMLFSLLLFISNVSLIRHEGLCLHNALSLLVAALYIGGTFLVYGLSDFLKARVFQPGGVFINPVFAVLDTVIPLFLLLMICYFECILLGTGILGYAAVKKKPAYDKDFVIILGCSIDKRGGLRPLLKGRANRAVRFAWDQEIACGKPVRYVPSGGQGPNEIMSEGSAMELYLLSHGAEDDEVFPEKKSRNTWENMLFSKKVIDGLKPDAKVAFATTNYHVLRSGILARKAGMEAEGVSSETRWYFWPNGFIREFFAILAMNKKVHLRIAAFHAAVCILIGCIGYFCHLFG